MSTARLSVRGSHRAYHRSVVVASVCPSCALTYVMGAFLREEQRRERVAKVVEAESRQLRPLVRLSEGLPHAELAPPEVEVALLRTAARSPRRTASEGQG